MKRIEDRLEKLPEPVQDGLRVLACVAFIVMVMGMAWLSLFL
jgi:hypothetical protein